MESVEVMKHSDLSFFPVSSKTFCSGIQELSSQQRHATQALEGTLATLAAEQQNYQTQFVSMVGQIEAKIKSSSDDALLSVQRIERQLDQVSTQMNILTQAQNEIMSKLVEGIHSIQSCLFSKEYSLDVCFERAYYREFPVEESPEFPDFQKCLLRLLAELDDESIWTVIVALNRLKIIKSSQEPWIALYSAAEKAKMQTLNDRYYSQVFKLSEGYYYYKKNLLPVNHFEPSVFWDLCCTPYLEHPERLRERDIIDAGAFIGDSALVLAPLTNRNVYAFEPTPQNYQMMLETLRMNKMDKVVPCPFALGDHRETLAVHVSSSFGGSGSTYLENDVVSYQETVETEMMTLDEFVQKHSLCVGLIKSDVEGAEQMLLKGALQTIREQKPALNISIYHNAGDFFQIKPMLEDLNLGYKFKIRHPVFGSILTETMLIAEV